MSQPTDRTLRLIPEGVTFLTYEVPISAELLNPTPLTPEQLAEYAAQREQRNADMRALADRLAALDGLGRAIADLHTPSRAVDEDPYCDGCDWSGMEGEPPDWPCRTIDALKAWMDAQ